MVRRAHHERDGLTANGTGSPRTGSAATIFTHDIYNDIPALARAIDLTKLISFDIDGTLEVGDPPGGITMEMVRQVKGLGYLIGSCSDRTVSEQQRIWREHGINVEFTVLKHRLDEVKEKFPADEYYHVGDTETDRRASLQAGFTFLPVGDAVAQILNGFPPQ